MSYHLNHFHQHLTAAAQRWRQHGGIGCTDAAKQAVDIAFDQATQCAKRGNSDGAKRWQWRLAWANACAKHIASHDSPMNRLDDEFVRQMSMSGTLRPRITHFSHGHYATVFREGRDEVVATLTWRDALQAWVVAKHNYAPEVTRALEVCGFEIINVEHEDAALDAAVARRAS